MARVRPSAESFSSFTSFSSSAFTADSIALKSGWSKSQVLSGRRAPGRSVGAELLDQRRLVHVNLAVGARAGGGGDERDREELVHDLDELVVLLPPRALVVGARLLSSLSDGAPFFACGFS